MDTCTTILHGYMYHNTSWIHVPQYFMDTCTTILTSSAIAVYTTFPRRTGYSRATVISRQYSLRGRAQFCRSYCKAMQRLASMDVHDSNLKVHYNFSLLKYSLFSALQDRDVTNICVSQILIESIFAINWIII